MNNKSITATGTLLGSLAAYYYARHTGKDATPYVMIGGFVGTLIGELMSGNGNNNGNKSSGQKSLK
jgi:presenilin-like A22 family membrane protease